MVASESMLQKLTLPQVMRKEGGSCKLPSPFNLRDSTFSDHHIGGEVDREAEASMVKKGRAGQGRHTREVLLYTEGVG